MIFTFWKFHIICNVNNIIIYCCIYDSIQKNENRRLDIYVCKSVTVLVRSQYSRKKSYLKTLIDASTEALNRSKHWAILRLAMKEKQLISNSISQSYVADREWYRMYFCKRRKYVGIKNVSSLCVHVFLLFLRSIYI